jgi:hypothetical protein
VGKYICGPTAKNLTKIASQASGSVSIFFIGSKQLPTTPEDFIFNAREPFYGILVRRSFPEAPRLLGLFCVGLFFVFDPQASLLCQPLLAHPMKKVC